MPKRSESFIEPVLDENSFNYNFLFILAVLVLVIILAYFVYKLFNKFNELSNQIVILRRTIGRITEPPKQYIIEQNKLENEDPIQEVTEKVTEDPIQEVTEETKTEDNLESKLDSNSKLSDIDEENDQ